MGLLAGSQLEAGLIHSWPLDGNSNDLFGTGNGTDTAVTYTTPKLGSACASFNGTTSRIVTATAGPTGAAPRTVSCWFMQSAVVGAKMGWGFGVQSAQSSFEMYTANGTQINLNVWGSALLVGSYTTGTWNHLVVTYDGYIFRGYLNGVAGTPVTLVCNTAAGPVYIGSGCAGTFNWNGRIDDVNMWSRALTAAEVTSLFNSGAGQYYPF